MNLPPLSFTVLDTETTGFVPKVHRVIEFASVRFEDGKKVDEYETLLSIPGEVPPPVEVLTRIRTGDLEGKPVIEDKRSEILEHIGDDTIIVGQNVGFDIRMLKGEEIDLTERPWFDTSMLASLVFPEFASYSLGYMSKTLGLHHEPVHRALGDVNATTELLSHIWTRLQELPESQLEELHHTMAASSPGYQMLFGALEEATKTERPSWMVMPTIATIEHDEEANTDLLLEKGEVSPHLIEEPLDPSALASLIQTASKDTETVHIIAVKNLDTALKHIELPSEARVLFPPWKLLDASAAENLMANDTFTSDEATLVTKLRWFAPENYNDLPLHGDERFAWNGKLACTEESDAYRKQFENFPGVALIDHQQLLTLIASENPPFPKESHIIVADASMLEDTATAAFDRYCSLDDLRAGAEGHETLGRAVDLLQIWIEKTRGNLDTIYITPAHVGTPDAKGLIERIHAAIEEGIDNPRVSNQLDSLLAILNPQNLPGRITWIEMRQNGSQVIRSAPEYVRDLLEEHLFSTFMTTLLVPPLSEDTLSEILPNREHALTTIEQAPVTLTIDTERDLASFFSAPPEGKTVLLVSSRKGIEEIFIKYTEALEEKGVTLICQNWGGGLGRMQAEFASADAPAIWVLTPWTYEGAMLPPGTVDHLVLQTLPFDFPSHPIFSRRAEHYQNGFMEYSLPRLEHRLFRLLRTFYRHRSETSDVTVIDQRLKTKKYGERVGKYLEMFTKASEASKATKASQASSSDQMSLF